MINGKIILLLCLVSTVLVAYEIKSARGTTTMTTLGDGSTINTTLNGDSPLISTTKLPDGTIERRYANGTVRHDYFVNSEFTTHMSFSSSVATSSTTTPIPPLDAPDSPDVPNLTALFLCLIDAGTILSLIAKTYSKPKPVERPWPKLRAPRATARAHVM